MTFESTREYPALQVLEDNYEVIYKEYLGIADKTTIWSELEIHNGKWEVYGIHFKGEDIHNACPQTTKLVNDIPGMYIAGFSVLKAGCSITPHTGYTAEVSRVHLGIICPSKCLLTVGNDTYIWQEGKVVVFDDMVMHSAHNKGDTDRVVLIVDIKKSEYVN